VKRVAAAILLLVVSIALFAYGAARHRVTVYVEEEREVSVLIPAPFGGGGGGAMFVPSTPGDAPTPGPGGSPSQNPFEAPSRGGEQNPFATPGDAGNPFQTAPRGVDSDAGPSPPEMRVQKIREKILVAHDEPERAIVRDVTVGGVLLLPDGLLKRTYSGRPPSLCPT
jgi:hypothetical protein